MLHSPLLIQHSSDFWTQVARILLDNALLTESRVALRDLSPLRVVVPTFAHAGLLKMALAAQLKGAFIPPRVITLSAWLAQQAPDPWVSPPATSSERLMSLYAELRQHAWLKKLFTARRNTDLLPLAQTLLTLSDELTQSLLPAMQETPDSAEDRWQAALAQLPLSTRDLLSDEAQLVWSIWKSQLGSNDACVVRYGQMLRLAQRADDPLVWISSTEPDPFEQAFLSAYGHRQMVLPIMPDWSAASVSAVYAAAWPELSATQAEPTEQPATVIDAANIATPANLSLFSAKSLEDEAQHGAQTVVNWLVAGKSNIAVIVQDRVVARRIRALLERAQVFVADDTGWKLSTSRAAAAIAAWFDVVVSRGETVSLLDLLKSPFLFADVPDKSMQVMAIESALRSANVLGGWNAVTAALADSPAAQASVRRIAAQAASFAGRKTFSAWIAATNATLESLGMRNALENDAAGLQVIEMLDNITHDCHAVMQPFSFAEWRAFINLQLESTAFVPYDLDHRVTILPLNSARLRTFEAVLLVGADADHLPSQLNETLFFSNGVRRELGLATRESRQRQQLRDLAELLIANSDVVLSWQSHKDGEPNAVSPWIARLQLTLERAGAAGLRGHQVAIAPQLLMHAPPVMPAPSAPQLLPDKLSASGYNSFVACPYQFFATRMLGLSSLDELSDMPEKRDYGNWLHRILTIYHETIRDQKVDVAERGILLETISAKIFDEALDQNGAALGYYVRWQKAIPAYLAWANEREAQGWHFVIGEQWFEKPLQWADGEIILHGRVDRIDRNESGELAVLDYKTKNVPALRDKLKQGEDHQLPFYGMLPDAPVEHAHYVALEPMKNKMGDVEAARYIEWKQALGEQIAVNMRAVAAGAALPATGIESICQYCEMRGLCRKGAW